jgi:flap endonuclease-1
MTNLRQFVDLCILLGCDYLDPIKGVGPKSALKLIREHGGLKGVVQQLREKYVNNRCPTYRLLRQ